MMKNILKLMIGIALVVTGSCQEIRTVNVTVTDENGMPIEGVNATITFLGYSGPQSKRIEGMTSKNGVFKASGAAQLRMYVRLEKEGYYATQSDRLSRTQDHDVKYVLRKIENPIPLYARKFRGKLPDLGKKCGFDFEVSDWVSPYGKGQKADLYFQADLVKNNVGKDAGKLEISFADGNEGIATIDMSNGLIPQSEMMLPHTAFDNGYSGKLERIESGYHNEEKPKNTSYFLRTRSKKMDDKTHQFNYAKIKDGIEFFISGGVFLEGASRDKHPAEVGVVIFTYYYNPTPNDRNLEFDPKRNLFTDLDPTEKVHDP